MEHIEQYLQLIEIYKQRFASKHEAKLSDLKKIGPHRHVRAHVWQFLPLPYGL